MMIVPFQSALGGRTGIAPFYISFVLAPLASNGTELLAAYSFALKKTVRFRAKSDDSMLVIDANNMMI